MEFSSEIPEDVGQLPVDAAMICKISCELVWPRPISITASHLKGDGFMMTNSVIAGVDTVLEL
jgi:hypothetical protein